MEYMRPLRMNRSRVEPDCGVLRREKFLSKKSCWLKQLAAPWFLYEKVVHFTMRTNGVNQAFRFGKGIRLNEKSRQIGLFFTEKTCFTSYVRNIF